MVGVATFPRLERLRREKGRSRSRSQRSRLRAVPYTGSAIRLDYRRLLTLLFRECAASRVTMLLPCGDTPKVAWRRLADNVPDRAGALSTAAKPIPQGGMPGHENVGRPL